MQLRPLHRVIVRHDFAEPLFAHCLTGVKSAEPRLTITSHRDGAGWLWLYLGGQIATDGVDKSAEALTEHARSELETCVPWIDWTDARFETLRVDRAEPAQAQGRRPDERVPARRQRRRLLADEAQPCTRPRRPRPRDPRTAGHAAPVDLAPPCCGRASPWEA